MRRPLRSSLALVASLSLLASTGCGLRGTVSGWFAPPEGPQPDLSRGVEVVDEFAILEFQERAQAFYDRLSLRRFNTHATYTDPVLRDHFRDDAAFFDYYADLAHSLDQEVAEQNRVLVAEVKEFALEGPGRARVQVRLRSNNGKPLRYWTVVSERIDIWERVDGTWWVVPGKI